MTLIIPWLTKTFLKVRFIKMSKSFRQHANFYQVIFFFQISHAHFPHLYYLPLIFHCYRAYALTETSTPCYAAMQMFINNCKMKSASGHECSIDSECFCIRSYRSDVWENETAGSYRPLAQSILKKVTDRTLSATWRYTSRRALCKSIEFIPTYMCVGTGISNYWLIPNTVKLTNIQSLWLLPPICHFEVPVE